MRPIHGRAGSELGRHIGRALDREEDRAGLVYRAMPEGRPATDFRRIAQGPSCIVFENPEHAFPRRVLYWREGAALHARIEGTRQGKPASKEWVWTGAAL